MKKIATLLLVSASLSHALDFQLGAFQSDVPGVYIEFRQDISNLVLGIHASEGFKEVGAVGPYGGPIVTTAQAALHNIGVLGGWTLKTSDHYKIQGSLGFGYSLLDGTEDGQPDRSRDYLALPLKVDAIYMPKVLDALPGLGIASALGVEYRIPMDKTKLYRELSTFVLTARIGLAL